MNATSSGSATMPPPDGPPRRQALRATATKLVLCPRHLAVLLSIAGLALVPWTIYLGGTLPGRQTAEHWDIAWIGLDVFMIIAIAMSAWAAWKQRQILIPASLAAAVLLVVDAWFDTMTASAGRDTAVALLMAVLIELPVAAFFAYVARRAFLMSVARVLDVPVETIRVLNVPLALGPDPDAAPPSAGTPAPPIGR